MDKSFLTLIRETVDSVSYDLSKDSQTDNHLMRHLNAWIGAFNIQFELEETRYRDEQMGPNQSAPHSYSYEAFAPNNAMLQPPFYYPVFGHLA
jgi:hypothetical protein